MIDTRFGNCSVVPLAYEYGGQVVHLPNGRVVMPSAFDYFKLEKDFTFNGEVKQNSFDENL